VSEYRRVWHPGGTYFFTHTILDRRDDLLVRHVEGLRHAVRSVQARRPFRIHGWVVLPDHFHCVIELPEGDSNYALRWRLIKQAFSRSVPRTEWRSETRERRGERGLWVRRYWEHLVRDERDFSAHVDYVHINPLKHGLVSRVVDWPYSTFHRLVKSGTYPADWAGSSMADTLTYPD
jgi:putative transposase